MWCEWQKALEADFANNLLTNAKIKASNVRGGHKKYSADNVNDADKTTYWATDDEITSASLTFTFDHPITFNRFLAQEDISLGQRVQEFTLEVLNEDATWREIASETTIGHKRILRLPSTTTNEIRLTIVTSKASPVISNIALYNAPKFIGTPIVRRDKDGQVTVFTTDNELDVFYTTDGTTPDINATAYKKPFQLDEKTELKVIAIDPDTQRQSTVAEISLGASKKKWKIIDTDNDDSYAIFDGNPYKPWFQSGKSFPIDLDIDLGENLTIIGFKYLPDQSPSRNSKGIIFNYDFFVSDNGKNWEKVSSGEFSNIKNSPIWQIKEFKPVKARYVKLRALTNTSDNNIAGYAEFDIITE